jgi:hypothetical protein
MVEMRRMTVASSLIRSIGHEINILEIEFHNGEVYQYSDVPPMVYNSMLNSKSQGVNFKTFIKGKYTEKQVS